MSDGARTRDTQDHNLVLYRLSYTHHRSPADTRVRGEPASRYRNRSTDPRGRGSGLAHAVPAESSGGLASPAARTAAKASTTSAAAVLAWSLFGPGVATNSVRR